MPYLYDNLTATHPCFQDDDIDPSILSLVRGFCGETTNSSGDTRQVPTYYIAKVASTLLSYIPAGFLDPENFGTDPDPFTIRTRIRPQLTNPDPHHCILLSFLWNFGGFSYSISICTVTLRWAQMNCWRIPGSGNRASQPASSPPSLLEANSGVWNCHVYFLHPHSLVPTYMLKSFGRYRYLRSWTCVVCTYHQYQLL